MKLLKKLLKTSIIGTSIALVPLTYASCTKITPIVVKYDLAPTEGTSFMIDEEGKVEIEFAFDQPIADGKVEVQIYNQDSNEIDLTFLTSGRHVVSVCDNKFKVEIYFERIPKKDINSIFSLSASFELKGTTVVAMSTPITVSFDSEKGYVDVKNGYINPLNRSDYYYLSVNEIIEKYFDIVQKNKMELVHDIYCNFGTYAELLNRASQGLDYFKMFNVLVEDPEITLVPNQGPDNQHVLHLSFNLKFHSVLSFAPFEEAFGTYEEIQSEMHFKDIPFVSSGYVGLGTGYYSMCVWQNALEGEAASYTEDFGKITIKERRTTYGFWEPTSIEEYDVEADNPTQWKNSQGSSTKIGLVGLCANSVSPWFGLPSEQSMRTAELVYDSDTDRLVADYENIKMHNYLLEEETMEELIGIFTLYSFPIFLQTDEQPYRFNDVKLSISWNPDPTINNFSLTLSCPNDVEPGRYEFMFNFESTFGLCGLIIPPSECVDKQYIVVYSG